MHVTQSLHQALQAHPGRVATRFKNRQRTFAEFADRVARLAGALRALGLQAEVSFVQGYGMTELAPLANSANRFGVTARGASPELAQSP